MNHHFKSATLVCAITFAAAPVLNAQNFILQSSVIGSGAVNGTSTNFKALGTVGQSAIGTGTSTNFKGSWGFWYTLGGGGATMLADLDVYLEGPWNSGLTSMNVGILSAIPTSQPFSGAPWSYGGSESVPATDTGPGSPNGIPDFFDTNNTIVDWVFVQLRTGNPAAPPMTVVAQRAGFLKSNGAIVDIDGTSALSFPGVSAGSYYVVVDHRNHLSAMSNAAIASASSTVTHNFTGAMASAYGASPMKSLPGGAGKFGLWGADGNVDKQVTAPDFNLYSSGTTAGAMGYQPADYNLDNQVTAPDFNIYNANTTAGATSKVPAP